VNHRALRRFQGRQAPAELERGPHLDGLHRPHACDGFQLGARGAGDARQPVEARQGAGGDL
jgi:hypothetical protein